jgi:hypothetical protein
MTGQERLEEAFLDLIDGMNEASLFAKHEQLWNLLHTMPSDDRDRAFIEWCYVSCDNAIAEMAANPA